MPAAWLAAADTRAERAAGLVAAAPTSAAAAVDAAVAAAAGAKLDSELN
jgi:hypothetical protein